MHTCLTLSNIGHHWYVEREIAGLMSALRSSCDSIDACEVRVEGPAGDGEARSWCVGLKLRVFDELVRTSTRAHEGSDPRLSLSLALAYILTSARTQLNYIAERHDGCCRRADCAAPTAKVSA